jgi:hypothetical protein
MTATIISTQAPTPKITQNAPNDRTDPEPIDDTPVRDRGKP